MLRPLMISTLVLTACVDPYAVRLAEDEAFATSTTRIFPPAQLGGQSIQFVTFSNGDEPAQLVGVRRRAGDPARVSPWLEEAEAVFSADFGNASLTPQEWRKIVLNYDPPATTTELHHSTELEFVFRTSKGESKVRVKLDATALNFTCAQAVTLDFLGVLPGTTETRDYVFFNSRPVEDRVVLTSAEPMPFSVGRADIASPQPLPAGEELRVPIIFAPTVVGRFDATLQPRRSWVCPPHELRLRGDGVASLLSLRPAEARTAAVGVEVPVDVVLENRAGRELAVTATISGEGFRLEGSRFVVHPATRAGDTLVPGQLTLPVRFQPPRAGVFTAEVRVETDVPQHPTLSQSVSGATP